MVVYGYDNKNLVPGDSLWREIQLLYKEHMVISLVGAGGKTSVMYGLADELAAMGKRVIITTSTRICCPADRQVVIGNLEMAVKPWIMKREKEGDTGWVLVTGKTVIDGKLRGLSLVELGKLRLCADVLLIEADGARRLPCKAPGAQEPVMIPETDAVIGCVGLDCIDKSIEETCFRPGLVAKLLNKPMNHRMTPADVADIISSENGTRKAVGARPYRILLNKADDEGRQKKAMEVLEQITFTGDMCGVVTGFLQDGTGKSLREGSNGRR